MTTVVVNRKALAEAMKRIKPVAEEALGEFVRLTLPGDGLVLTSRGGDMSINATVEAGYEEAGATIVVNQPELAKFVVAAKGDDCVLTFGDVLRVSCGTSAIEFLHNGHWNVPVAAVPHFDSVGSKEMSDAIKFAAVGMSKEKVRYNMRGLWFQNHAAGLTVWGCSGPFMHRAFVPDVTIGGDGTVPYDAIDAIKGIGDGIGIDIRGQEWIATIDHAVMWGPLLGDPFPNVRGLITSLKELGVVARINRDAMVDAVAVAAVGASDGDKPMVTIEAKASGLWFCGTERSSAVKVAGQHLIECQIETPVKITIDTANLKKSVAAFPPGPIEIVLCEISNGKLLRLSCPFFESYLMGVMA